jgi:hypothetical protein
VGLSNDKARELACWATGASFLVSTKPLLDGHLPDLIRLLKDRDFGHFSRRRRARQIGNRPLNAPAER